MRYMTKFYCTVLAGLILNSAPAQAGLDLENQEEIRLEWLDLDLNGRITRTEVGEYLFFYFDRDGNESLSRGEYSKEREITFIPYEGEGITFVDINHDGQHDGTDFTTETFLHSAMIGEYDPEADGIEADEVLDKGYLKADSDRSKYIELDEWQKIYGKGAKIKANAAPKSANQDRYRN